MSPDILGVSAGAGFGAVLGILLSLPVIAIQGLGFATGLLTVGIVYTLARALRSQNEILVLVLAGIVVGALAGAGISLVKILADPYNQLPAITFWLLGSLSGIKVSDLQTVAPLVILGLVPLALLRWRIGVLSLGDDEAKALGVNVRVVRGVVIMAATLVTATAVSVSGVIGWIGLVIPHMARLLVGPRYDRVLPAAVLMGAAFLVLIDTVARSAARIEIPLGLLTALLGAPVFVWLLARGRRMLELTVLQASALSIGYAGRTVAAGIDLAVQRGEVLCLLGPNGAGKTTLFKTLLGLIPALGGEVTIDGRPIDSFDAPRAGAVDGLCPAGAGHGVRLHRPRPGADGTHGASRAVLRAGTARPRAGAGGAGRSRHRRACLGRGQPHLRRPAPALPGRPRARPGCAPAGDGRADRQPRSRQSPAGAGAGAGAAAPRATPSCSRPTIRTRRASLRPPSPSSPMDGWRPMARRTRR